MKSVHYGILFINLMHLTQMVGDETTYQLGKSIDVLVGKYGRNELEKSERFSGAKAHVV